MPDTAFPPPIIRTSASTPALAPVPRALLIAAAAVVVVAGMRAAAPVLLPAALALFLAILNLPLLRWLTKRVPAVVAIVIVVLANVGVLSFLLLVLSRTLTEFVNTLPTYLLRLQDLVLSVLRELERRGLVIPPDVRADLVNPTAVLDVARTTVRGIMSVLATALLVLIILIFMLAEASGIPAKIRLAVGRTDFDIGRYARIVDEVQRFLGIKTLISLVTGCLVGVWVWMLGIDFPLLWGLVAYLLNYIPAIGSVIASIPAILLALVQFGVSHAILVACGYLAVNVGMGNLLEPHLMGRRLGLSALVVVLSLIFWGWVLGPVGMFLSVPLTVMAKIMLENTDEFRWVAVLLDSARPASVAPEPARPAIADPALVQGRETL